MNAHEAELAKLKKELRDVKMERDILKKVITTFFSIGKTLVHDASCERISG